MSFLPRSTPRYEYQGVKQCLGIFEQEIDRFLDAGGRGNPYVSFSMDKHSFLALKNSKEDVKLLTKSVTEYDHTSHILLLEIESTVHSCTSAEFQTVIQGWARGFPEILIPLSTAGIDGTDKSKRADGAFQPAILPNHRDRKWPSMIIEVAWNQTRSSIKRDMMFWLGDSRQQVKVALSVTVHQRGQIVVERWRLDERNVLSVSQTMTIRRDTPRNRPRMTGELTIAFEDIFLKAKELQHTHFTLEPAQLEAMAEIFWTVQFTEAGRQS